MPARLTILTALALAALTPGPALTQTPVPRLQTAFTLLTDQPRTPEQEAVHFDLADLSIQLLPDDKAIEGTAELMFTALSPVSRLVVELDTVFDISEVSVDGTGWRSRTGQTRRAG